MRLVPPLLLLLASACATARMPVPEPLAPVPEWEVQTRGWRADRMRMGPYEAHHVDRDQRRRGGILDAIAGKREYQYEYRFLLRDTTAAEDLWQARCDHRDVERGLSVAGVRVELDDRTSLECTFHPPGDPSAPWTLRMGSRSERMPEGALRAAGADSAGYEVRALTVTGRDCCSVDGFVVRKAGRPVASVDLGGRGRVRLGAEEERPLLAAVAFALLLWPERAEP